MSFPAIFKHFSWALLAAGALLATTGTVTAQQKAVPERRLVVIQNMDFYGADMQPVFETSFKSCRSICLADTNCRAFTFNVKSNACFPKTAVGEMTPFDGAVSARVLNTDPAVLKSAAARAKSVEFLGNYFTSRARALADDLGAKYVTNQWTADQLTEASRAAANGGNNVSAIKFIGAALNLTDSADGWLELSVLALNEANRASDDRAANQEIATSAALNAFFRGRTPAIRATALNQLATALEARGYGTLTIPTLQLSNTVEPRLETADALERVIGLYGFRITEHKIDNNARIPRACVTFSDPLVAAGVEYSDFVRVADSGLSVEAQDNQICIEGLHYGQRTRITFREGLPAKSGETLRKSVDIDVYVKDRDPSVHFVGKAYVLPKGEGATIPIVTTNLTEVDLKIHRVGDRNLVRVIRQGYFNRPVSYWDENDLDNDIGEQVWSGKGIVQNEINQDVTTALPVGDAIKKFEPGVYVMQARVPGADPYDSAAAAQWFIVTDLGLATMTGGDGLHVFVRSLNTAQAKAGVRVQLLAVNNNVLGEAVTDAAGYALFAPGLMRGSGGAEPALVTAAQDDSDFAFLSLKDPAFDLSDRGVTGRPASPPIDIFMTTDRGAYRTGDTVYATALARDSKAEAIADLPLTAIVTRPDGIEFTRELLPDQGAGGRVLALHLPVSAQRGTWNIRIHGDVDQPALTSQKFLVEDLIPERIDFDLAMGDAPVHVTDAPQIDIAAKYLYGAPGADLAIEAEARVMLADGLDGYPGYQFGRQDQAFSTQVDYTPVDFKTDANGKAAFNLVLPSVNDVDRPLKMLALIRLKEGSGRPVERAIERALAPSRTIMGIKPLFDGVVAEGDLARFEVLAVGADMKQVPLGKVRWVLNRINTRYQWYNTYGNWDYERVETRISVSNGQTTLAADAAQSIEAPVDWGQYELKLETLDGEYLSASYRFWAGWYAPADSGNTPDTLEVGLDKDAYKIGDTAKLRLVPRYAGTALVTVMSNHLIAMKTVQVTEGENLIDLPVTEEWGAGAYVTANVIRPMNVAAGRNPARALGLNYATVDPGKHRLTAAFISASEADPRGLMIARLKVDGAAAGDTVYATIAAVDLGILNITGFKSPDPSDYYFGQRKLGMDMRDVYGRLIDGTQGANGQIRSGGDGPLPERMASPPPTEDLVSFFSGPLKVGADGMVEAEFDLPEFNGTVRLMAVVWSETAVGEASQDVLVRDPVVLTASVPRFLAPYDASRMLLEITHTSGPSGEVSISVTASKGLYLNLAGLPASVTLAEHGRASFAIPLAAPASGTPEITIALTTPDGKLLTKTLSLAVRALDPEIALTTRVELKDGATFTLNNEVFAGMVPGTGHASLAVGPIARFDVPGILKALDRYPYGCSEQLTSKALPLLYFEAVADAMGLSKSRDIASRINTAITGVLSNQSSGGGFGLWGPGSGDLWLDAYVSDFLTRARSKGYSVPDQAFRLAMDNLRNKVNYAPDFEDAGQDIAYALMVLAREGAANIGDLRYYADTKADQFGSALAMAQLGAALASYGDQTRADFMFRKAGARLDTAVASAEQQYWRADYGTNLRDSAAILALAAEARTEVLDQTALVNRIVPGASDNRSRSTQENTWTLLAANALLEETPADAFLVNGQPAGGPVVEVLDAQTGLERTVEVLNQSGKSATTILTTYGIPAEPEPAGGNGYTINRFYFTLDGKPVTPDHLRQNDRLVVVLKVTPSQFSEARLIVNDPLPAGLEIDNPALMQAGDVAALDWLLLNGEPQHVEFRAERFIAAVDWRSKEPMQLAYIVRAISPGKFHHPAASVEDMYRPQFRARTGVGTVEVAAQ